MGAQAILLDRYQLTEQVVLRVEIPVDRPVGQLRLFGDISDRGVVKTVAGKDFLGRGDDLVTPLRLLLLAGRGAPAGAGAVSHDSVLPGTRPQRGWRWSRLDQVVETPDGIDELRNHVQHH